MRPRSKQVVSLALAGAVFATTGYQIPAINRQRQDEKLVANLDIPDNAPPDIAITQLGLGAFRGLAVDLLFLRAMRLKDKGRYFDAKQLSDFIGKLQPHYSAVWVFNAWNMAYNISVCLPTGPERWLWVNNGIDLLRRQAIPLNPTSTELYRNLSWIFFHKLGQWSDYMHWYHRYRLAVQMERIIGPDMSMEAIKRMSEAPATEKEFVKDPACAALLKKFRQVGIKSAAEYALLVEAYYRGLGGESDKIFDKASPFREDEMPLGVEKQATHFSDRQLSLLEVDPDKGDPVLAKLDAFWRRQWIHSKLNMDPAKMLEMMNRLGPLDWRTPEAHAIYWAALGMELASGKLDTQELNTDRLIYQSIQNIAFQGRLVLRRNTAMLYVKPDLRSFDPPKALEKDKRYAEYRRLGKKVTFLDVLDAMHHALKDKYASEEAKKKDVFYYSYDWTGPYGMAHRNFLENAVRILYQYNEMEHAKRFFQHLQESYPIPRYDVGFERFPLVLIKEEAKSMSQRDATAQVMGFLKGSWEAVALGEEGKAEGLRKWARSTYAFYQKGKGSEKGHRVSLPPWKRMQQDSLRDCMQEWKSRGPKWALMLNVLVRRLGIKPPPEKQKPAPVGAPRRPGLSL